ncbi:assembly 26-like [Argonauta hians]
MTAVVRKYNIDSLSSERSLEIPEYFSINKDCENVINQAKVHLMLREFSECLTTCNEGIKQCNRLFHDGDCYESFVILAIQAYGEQNKWKEVLPFIDEIYGNVNRCPPTVVKLFISLLAWAKEYNMAEKQACLWLKNPENIQRDHTGVGRLVIEDVLLPQKNYQGISYFVERRLHLTVEEKKKIQNFVSEVKKIEDSKENRVTKIVPKKEEEQNLMLSLIERMKTFMLSLSPFIRHRSGKFIFFSVSLYLVFLHLRVEYSVFGLRDLAQKLLRIYRYQFTSKDSKN